MNTTTMLIQELVMQNRDNLFNAKHRREMIARYGFTSAQTITIGDLLDERN